MPHSAADHPVDSMGHDGGSNDDTGPLTHRGRGTPQVDGGIHPCWRTNALLHRAVGGGRAGEPPADGQGE
jgi:hypothetical protein